MQDIARQNLCFTHYVEKSPLKPPNPAGTAAAFDGSDRVVTTVHSTSSKMALIPALFPSAYSSSRDNQVTRVGFRDAAEQNIMEALSARRPRTDYTISQDYINVDKFFET